ncbi:GNAT family N-acetyltransferase [Pseudoruegeria sp. SHC-113]|uniref:GNAT family N-acetyltransferase n=1 Tax=Pseudoruegeria sp. SHC-113 TaxID=2855439 RepID=UPI0021BB78BD|nr:GNAT family N-acetyltransferase [Pseudoruegeria sp. SHC-113]MCT8162054.1 GNAT family N-acetyltransferase [Pseudoruegeria sp. SHC-113]
MADHKIRLADPADFTALGQVMYAAIHATPSPYSAEARTAWLPAPNSGPAWEARLASQFVLLADSPAGPAGFASLTPDGYIDLAFLLPAARGTGLFRQLIAGLEAEAWRRGIARLHTHASLAAEGPFRALGFAELQRETVLRAGIALRRVAMEKPLL